MTRADIGSAGLVDVRVEGGAVTDVAPSRARRGGQGPVVDAGGNALLPGLHDHHVHLPAAAAAEDSAPAGPPAVTDAAALSRSLGGARPGKGGWIRAVGYHDSVAGELDRDRLDALLSGGPADGVPVRVQHRSGALWVVNSAGVSALGLDGAAHPGVDRDRSGRPTGRLFRMDDWLAPRWGRGAAPPDLTAVSRRAAARGVTGFTEAGPGLTPERLAYLEAEVESGRLAQRLVVMWSLDPRLAGHPPGGQVMPGPVKIMLDDLDLPVPDDLAATVGAAYRLGMGVAVHCVTRVQLVVTLEALGAAGPAPSPPRIEHGAVVPDEAVAALGALGATVVTNPSFVAERGDRYLAEVDPADRPHLYRAASLREAGVAVAAGTDAPFGSGDPWEAVRAAVERRTAAGAVVGPGERVPARVALDWFLGRPDRPASPRRIEPGAPADLCLLDGPLAEVLADPGAVPVVLTLVGGRVVHGEDPAPAR